MTRRLHSVHVLLTCDDCENGIIENELWQEFNAQYSELPSGPGPDGAEAAERIINDWWSARGYDEVPPEAQTCPECNGAGARKAWLAPVDFAMLLAEEFFKKLSGKG